VGIEVDTAHGPLGGDGPQDREGNRVVATGRDRHDTRGMQRGEKRLNLVNAIREVERVLGGITDVGHVADVEWRDGARGVHPTNQARHLPDLGRAVTDASPIGRAEIEGHANRGITAESRGWNSCGRMVWSSSHRAGLKVTPPL